MDTLDQFNEHSLSTFFYCEKCDYNTCKKYNYDRHLLTDRHKRIHNGYKMIEQIEQIEQTEHTAHTEQTNKYSCLCGNAYKFSQGLSKHKKKCIFLQTKQEITPELILKVIEQNKELTNIILQQNTTINKLCDNSNNTNITNNNNTQINNSNNKTFNLNLYLNETCKNAMNIDEFIDNIKLSLEDLEYTGRKGYIEGISNIILKNLNLVSEYYRPIHCSDNKREVLYIKRNNIWNKEEDDKPILTNAIKVIANQNIKQITKWKEKNPDCINAESKKNNLYLKIVSNSMCGIDKEETTKNINKIVSNLAKEVTINKK